MATEYKYVLEDEKTSAEFDSLGLEPRMLYPIKKTGEEEYFDLGYVKANGERIKLLKDSLGLVLLQNNYLPVYDENKHGGEGGFSLSTFFSDLVSSGSDVPFSSVNFNSVKSASSGFSLASLGLQDGSGGFVNAYHSNGDDKNFEARGYQVDGVQAFFKLGGVVIGGDELDGNESLRIIGDMMLNGNAKLKASFELKEQPNTVVEEINIGGNYEILFDMFMDSRKNIWTIGGTGGGDGDIFISANDGINFTKIYDTALQSISCVGEGLSQRMLFGSGTNAGNADVYYTDDHVTFVKVEIGETVTVGRFRSFFNAGTRLFMGFERTETVGAFLYYSDDNGLTWTKVLIAETGTAMSRISGFASFGGALFAVMNVYTTGVGAVYKSINNGLTWSLVYETMGSYPLGVFSDGINIYVNHTNGVVFKSSDGVNFSDVPVHGTYPSTVSVYSIRKLGDCFVFVLGGGTPATASGVLVTTCDFINFKHTQLSGFDTRVLYNFTINISGDLVFATTGTSCDPFILKGFLTNYLSDDLSIFGNKFGTVSHSSDGTYHSKVSNMYQGIFRNNLIVRDNYNRVSQAMLTKAQGSGGRLLLYDNTGAPKVDIRGYVLLGTQAYFALGGVAIGADQVSSTEMLYVVGDSKVTGQVLLPNIATSAGGVGTERLYWDSSASCVKWG